MKPGAGKNRDALLDVPGPVPGTSRNRARDTNRGSRDAPLEDPEGIAATFAPVGKNPAYYLLIFVFVAGVGTNDLFAARQRCLDELAAARTILHRMERHRDRIARFHGIGTHAHGDEP